MEASDHRNSVNLPYFGGLFLSTFWRILIERNMSLGHMIGDNARPKLYGDRNCKETLFESSFQVDAEMPLGWLEGSAVMVTFRWRDDL